MPHLGEILKYLAIGATVGQAMEYTHWLLHHRVELQQKAAVVLHRIRRRTVRHPRERREMEG